jgi:cob(I)alamin adenosyltransferase
VNKLLTEVREIREQQPNLHIIMTGRNAPAELVEAADLVTEMKEIKHPFHAGIYAQQGIEF